MSAPATGWARAAVVGVQCVLPVRHRRVGDGAAEQPVRARALEELLDAPVRVRDRQVDVLAGDVEQPREPLAHLGDARLGVRAPCDVGDDALDRDAAAGPVPRTGAVPQRARDAVDAVQPVGDFCLLAAQQAQVEALVVVPVARMDARLPEVPGVGAVRPRSAEEVVDPRADGVVDVVPVGRDLAGIDELLEEVEDAREVGRVEARVGVLSASAVREPAACEGAHPRPERAAHRVAAAGGCGMSGVHGSSTWSTGVRAGSLSVICANSAVVGQVRMQSRGSLGRFGL